MQKKVVKIQKKIVSGGNGLLKKTVLISYHCSLRAGPLKLATHNLSVFVKDFKIHPLMITVMPLEDLRFVLQNIILLHSNISFYKTKKIHFQENVKFSLKIFSKNLFFGS